MKIAVFGYYNALNAGDDRIQDCITKLLKGHTVVFLPHFLPPPKEYIQSFDWILIGGGGLVFERVGIWVKPKQWIKKCKAKIGVFGLGVNHVSSILLEEVYTIINHSEFFFVRDEQSKILLNNHPKINVQPDPTWCFPFQFQTNLIEENKSIALNLLPCHWKQFEPNAWVKSLSEFEVQPFPFHFGTDRDGDLLESYYSNSTPKEFSLEPLIKSQIVVACRFHAIIFAMQLGKVFIAINYDDKVKRLLTDADLLECCLETTEHNLLKEKIEFVKDNKAILRQKINKFAQEQINHAENLKEEIQRHLLLTPRKEKTRKSASFLKNAAKKLQLMKT